MRKPQGVDSIRPFARFFKGYMALPALVTLSLARSAGLALLLSEVGVAAQGTFQNLNFEAAQIPSEPQAGSLFPVSIAFPGWSVSYSNANGISAASLVAYDTVSLGGPGIVIIDTHNVRVSPLQGKYSAYLFGGNSPIGPTSTTISQTGLVPNGARAISVDAYAWNGFTLSLNGQTIINNVGAGVLSGVYSGNISAFAGQTAQLSITVPSSPYMDVNPTGLLIDDIEISTIPEPSILGLAALGAWLLGWRVLACPWKPAPIQARTTTGS